MAKENVKNIVIIGGGAAGIFAALRCAEVSKQQGLKTQIQVLEASTRFLTKVRISGGGRCNVTHHIFEPKQFCENYPRGRKELLSPFQVFQAQDTVDWFKKRGVNLKYESDGRMFPTTDRSETIIECFMDEAERHRVQLLTKKEVKGLSRHQNGQISVKVNTDETLLADRVLLATGSKASGYRIAKTVGHSITELAPSLFTFKIKDLILNDLAGTSFSSASLTLNISGKKPFRQKGPLLITHWGLSGPALLKLSAWAAREMMHANYQAKLTVNWLGIDRQDQLENILKQIKEDKAKSLISNAWPEGLTKRFWSQLLQKVEIAVDKRWADVSKKEFRRILQTLFACELTITGKSRFKEEFVECGGVNLKEINLKTMESKIFPGLFFSGEVMDVDGITGGFNFQNAWTSAWIAGTHMLGARP